MIHIPTMVASITASALIAVSISPASTQSNVDNCLQEGVAVTQYHNANGTTYLAPTRKTTDPYLIVAVWTKECQPKHLTKSFMTWGHAVVKNNHEALSKSYTTKFNK